MTETLDCWHFLALPAPGQEPRLGYDDGRIVRVGETLSVDPPVELCRSGLHASEKALDALRYAPGALVCRVRLSGKIVRGEDKAVATHRTVLWMADATVTLRRFAIWCAREALLRERAAGREPDPRSWWALEVTEAWVDGTATDEERQRAADAAAANAAAAAANTAYAAYAAAYAAYADAANAAYAADANANAYAAYYAADAYAAYAADANANAYAAYYAADAYAAARAEIRSAQEARLTEMLRALAPKETP